MYERHRTTLSITDELVTPGPGDENDLPSPMLKTLTPLAYSTGMPLSEMPASPLTGT